MSSQLATSISIALKDRIVGWPMAASEAVIAHRYRPKLAIGAALSFAFPQGNAKERRRF